MNDIANQLQAIVDSTNANLPFLFGLLLIFWLVHLVNWVFHYRLNILGIYPRSWHGVIGIVVSPFLHGNFNHIFFNSIPLFVLADLVLLNGRPEFYCVSITVILLSGAAVWLLGRRAIHIGASGLILGYWGFLLISAFQERTALAIILAIISVYYFSGLVLNLLPKAGTSWEGHVFGFLAGLAAIYLCPLSNQLVHLPF